MADVHLRKSDSREHKAGDGFFFSSSLIYFPSISRQPNRGKRNKKERKAFLTGFYSCEDVIGANGVKIGV